MGISDSWPGRLISLSVDGMSGSSDAVELTCRELMKNLFWGKFEAFILFVTVQQTESILARKKKL